MIVYDKDGVEVDTKAIYQSTSKRTEKFDEYNVKIDPVDGSVFSVQKLPNVVRNNVQAQHNYWFIGDIHSNIESYMETLRKIYKEDPSAVTIQVGDLDLGTPGVKLPPKIGVRNFFIQGNHDNIEECEKHPNFLGKFGFKHGVFFLGGAETGGIGYKGEELSTKELNNAIELYEHVKPEIVVTHDCPEMVRREVFYKKETTRTSSALDEMFDIHQPLVWAYGHHHIGQTENIDGTDFICCAPLTAYQLKLCWTLGLRDKGKEIKPVQMTAKKAISRFFGRLF